MKLIDDGFRPRATKVKNAIAQCSDVNDLARLAYVVGLKMGGRVRNNELAVDPKFALSQETLFERLHSEQQNGGPVVRIIVAAYPADTSMPARSYSHD